jgi:exosortase/archaeosortase family protein
MSLILSIKELGNKAQKFKPLLLFVVKAVSVYTILNLCYIGYVGLADPRGTYTLPEFMQSWNLVFGITQAHIWVSSLVLNIVGYETVNYDTTLLIKGASGVRIAFACLGIKLWIALIALIMSFPIQVASAFKKQLMGAAFGVLVIFLLNIVRIVSIILTNHYDNRMIDTIHDAFNNVVYVFIFVYFLLWINYFSKVSKSKVGKS